MRADSYFGQVLHHLAGPDVCEDAAPSKEQSFLGELRRELAGCIPSSELGGADSRHSRASAALVDPPLPPTTDLDALVDMKPTEAPAATAERRKPISTPLKRIRFGLVLACAVIAVALINVTPKVLGWINPPDPSKEIPAVPASQLQQYQPRNIVVRPGENGVRVRWDSPREEKAFTSYYVEAHSDADDELAVSELTEAKSIDMEKITSSAVYVCYTVNAVIRDSRGALSLAPSGEHCAKQE